MFYIINQALNFHFLILKRGKVLNYQWFPCRVLGGPKWTAPEDGIAWSRSHPFCWAARLPGRRWALPCPPSDCSWSFGSCR